MGVADAGHVGAGIAIAAEDAIEGSALALRAGGCIAIWCFISSDSTNRCWLHCLS